MLQAGPADLFPLHQRVTTSCTLLCPYHTALLREYAFLSNVSIVLIMRPDLGAYRSLGIADGFNINVRDMAAGQRL